MRLILIALLSIVCFTKCFAQNVILNGSFENYIGCPTHISQVDSILYWRTYTLGSPDYFNACNGIPTSVNVPGNGFGYEPAADGQAYTGMILFASGFPNYREYIATTFPALTVNKSYEVSLSVSLADNYYTGADAMGVWFYQNGPATITNSNALLPVTPQVSYSSYGPITNKTGWQRMIKYFTPDSAYTNLVIGGFFDQSQIITSPPNTAVYAYYFIDSVVVKSVVLIQINFSIPVLCAGTTISVPYTTSSTASAAFSNGNMFQLQLSDASGSFASPVIIGSVTSTTSGTITGVIPPNTPMGTGYRLRVASTNGVHYSENNGSNIQIVAPGLLASANMPACTGSNISLLATGALSGSVYSWSGPSSFSSTQQNPVISNAANNHTGDYIVTATKQGCIAKDTVSLTVLPTPAITSAVNNGPLCAGSTLQLNAQSSITGATINWTGPSSFTSTLASPAISNAGLSNQGNYTVTAMLNGCASAPVSTMVTIYPIPPTPTVSVNSPVCITGTINLTATGNPSGTYSWAGPSSFTSAAQNPVISNAGLNMAGTYTVTLTENGCTSAPGNTQVLVLYSPASVACYALPGDTICAGGSVNLIAAGTNAGATPQYQWLKNGQLIGGANSISYTTSALQPGDKFSVILTPSTNCSLPDTSAEKEITVAPWVTPTVSINATPGTLISPWQMVTFNTSVTNEGSNPKFQWKRNSQNINGAVYNTWGAYTLSNNDTIWVEMMSSEKCPSPATAVSNKIVIQIKTGVNDVDKGGTGLSLYPNPNNGRFTLTGTVPDNEILNFQILNSIGQMVYSNSTTPENNIVDAEIAVSGTIPVGLYLLRIQNSHINETIRLIVE